MEKQRVYVGGIVGLSGCETEDDRREVEFEGEEIARATWYGHNERTGGLTDTRGVTQVLYRTPDGRYIVHTEAWSRWQGEPTTYHLREVLMEDLQPGGEYEVLGYKVIGRPLTLDEALGR